MSNRTFLGKVGTTPKGEWSASVTYERLDWVTYQGSSYIALAQNTNSVPSDTNTNWMVAAKHGEFTEEQLEEFKEEVVRESKQEIDDYTDDKKEELDTYEGQKESELNTYTTTKKEEIDTHTAGKINDYNTNADTKTRVFNTNAETKTTNFNDNATSKTNAYNQNAEDKTTAFNTNAANKQTAFDNNATQKTTAFNENATSKTTDFNDNASDKTQDFDDNAEDKTEAFDQNAADKTAEFDTHTIELEQEIADLRAASYKIYTETPSTNVTLNKTSKNKFIKFGVNGNREQTTYTGANVFPTSQSNTDATQYNTMLYGGTYLQTNTQHTIKVKGKSGDKYRTATGQYGVCTSNVVFTIGSDGIGTATFTTKESYEGVTGYAILQNYSANNTLPLTEITIAEGTEPTYEPYTGKQPSPNPTYKQDIYAVGDDINLFDGIYENAYTAGSSPYKYIASATSRSGIVKVKPNTTYTISKELSGRFRIAQYSERPVAGTTEATSYVQAGDSNTTYTLTTDSTTQYLAIQVSNESQDNVKMKVQEGSIATPYSPYNMGNVNVVKCNKNWLDKDNPSIVWSPDTTVRYSSLYIGKGTYTMSSPDMPYDSIGKNMFILPGRVSTGANSNTNGVDKNTPRTITTEDGYITIANRYTLTTTQNLNHPQDYNWMLELGSIATDYTPHEEEVFNIPCQKPMPDIADYFDWDNEKEVHGWKKLVLDGTENFSAEQSAGLTRFNRTFNDLEYYDGRSSTLAISNYFTSSVENAYGVIMTYQRRIMFYVSSSITTVEAFQAYLAEQYANGTPVYIWYKLAEPEQLSFTEAQKTVAEQIEDSTSYYEQTNVYSNDNVSPILDITAVGDQNLVIDSIDARLSLVE